MKIDAHELYYLDRCDEVEADIRNFLITGQEAFLDSVIDTLNRNPHIRRPLCRMAQGILISINQQLGLTPKTTFSSLLEQIEAKFEIDNTARDRSLLSIPSQILINRERLLRSLLSLYWRLS